MTTPTPPAHPAPALPVVPATHIGAAQAAADRAARTGASIYDDHVAQTALRQKLVANTSKVIDTLQGFVQKGGATATDLQDLVKVQIKTLADLKLEEAKLVP
jgi:hypothetical protein